MKKTFRIVGATLMCALVPAMVSCGGDDDGPNVPDGPGNSPGGINGGTEQVEGVFLTSVDGVTINYDNQGRVSSLRGGDNSLTIDYSTGKLILPYDDEMGEFNISFNGKGYISGFSQKWNVKDEDGYYTGSGSASISYDGTGHLTKIHMKSNETYRDEDGNGKYYEEETYNLNWKNGNLVSVKISGTENEDGEVFKWTETYDIDYSNNVNQYKMVSFNLYDQVMDNEQWAILACAGLFGVGTTYLPDSMEYEDTDSDNGIEYYNFTFGLNNDGTIDYDRMRNNTAYYGYDRINVRSAANGNEFFKKNFNLFRTHKTRKAAK